MYKHENCADKNSLECVSFGFTLRRTVSFLLQSSFVIIIYNLHNFFCLWKDPFWARYCERKREHLQPVVALLEAEENRSTGLSTRTLELFELLFGCPACSCSSHHRAKRATLLESCFHLIFRPIYYVLNVRFAFAHETTRSEHIRVSCLR